MPVDGKHCTCVTTSDNFIRDVNNFGNFTEYNILKSIHRQMLEDDRRCSVHTDEKSSLHRAIIKRFFSEPPYFIKRYDTIIC